MKIFNSVQFPVNTLNSLGSNFSVSIFTDAIPSSIDDIPFDINNNVEVLANSVATIIVQASVDLKYLVTKNVINTKRPSGYAYNLDRDKVQVLPKVGKFSPGFDNLAFSIEPENSIYQLGRLFGVPGYSAATLGSKATIDTYIEYTFDADVSIDYIDIEQQPSSSYAVGKFKLQYLDAEGEWVLGEELNLTYNNVASGTSGVALSKSYTSSKFRLVVAEVTSQPWYLNSVKFYSSEPADNTETGEFTWFLLKSTNQDLLELDNSPVLIGSAGGPNGGKDLALNLYKAKPGLEVKLMNLKIRSNPMESL